jgi:hypothetical protein
MALASLEYRFLAMHHFRELTSRSIIMRKNLVFVEVASSLSAAKDIAIAIDMTILFDNLYKQQDILEESI